MLSRPSFATNLRTSEARSRCGDVGAIYRSPRPLLAVHIHGRGEKQLCFRDVDQRQKTPPRAWGRPLKIPAALWRPGNTPTGVGKTPQSDVCFVVRRKHPHGRGEDKRGSACEATSMETPPRAWGRQLLTLARLPGNRNTPTGVGKTFTASQSDLE